MNNKEERHMFQYLGESHPELQNTLTSNMDLTKIFTFKVLQKHPSSLNRKVTEAVKIIRAGDSVLISKEDYNRSSKPGNPEMKRPRTRSQEVKTSQAQHMSSTSNTPAPQPLSPRPGRTQARGSAED